jgi:D-3-phosphoglycerate dehydrogenase / 2-oxoglutarate reductase
MKIVVADPISPQGLEVLTQRGWEVVRPGTEALPAALLDADALIVRSATRVTEELLAAAPRLRVVGRAGVGVDNIDLEAATRRGVLVMNTPGGNAVSVAEHTLALLLALTRRVPQLNAAIHAGRWEKTGEGRELRGKTLGLVGFGRVASEVAPRARAFEMRVLAYDPYVSESAARDAQVELVTLPVLLAQSDFVSLHTSLGPATEKLINATTLAQSKRGAALINTKRGELVDEAALAEALRSGQLSAAALDVFETEPPRNSPLLDLANVIATPHVAGSTREAQEEVGTRIAQQVRDFLNEGALRNAVNLPSLSGEQYNRARPWLELAERLGAFVAQLAPGRLERVCVTLAGEPAELGTSVLRNAALAGLLNRVLDERVNLVNASQLAEQRGLAIEERVRRRDRGYPHGIELLVALAGNPRHPLSAAATLVPGSAIRILSVDGMELEAPLAGTMLFFRNRDVPGVIGQIGTALGNQGVNISTFALGRVKPGGDALALLQLDGEVPESVLDSVREIPSITEARLIRLPPETGQDGRCADTAAK